MASSPRPAAGRGRGRRTAPTDPRTARASRRCPIAKFRLLNRSSRSIGSRARDSYNRNAANRVRPAISEPATAGFDQPKRGCSIRANTVPPKPSTQSSAPTTSTRRCPAVRGDSPSGDRLHDQPQARDYQRHVDDEDPPPRADTQNRPGDERPERPSDRAPRRPRADRRAALAARETC